MDCNGKRRARMYVGDWLSGCRLPVRTVVVVLLISGPRDLMSGLVCLAQLQLQAHMTYTHYFFTFSFYFFILYCRYPDAAAAYWPSGF